MVPLIITQALSTASSTDDFTGEFVQTLHEQILSPAVMHFGILSESKAASLHLRRTNEPPEHQRTPESTDLRPILLGLCQSSLASLRSNDPHAAASLSVVLSHSVVTQLKSGLDASSKNNAAKDGKSSNTAMLVRRLAFKDTFWYLVSVLHVCFSQPASTKENCGMSPLEAAARTAVLVSLAEILNNKEGGLSLGQVERNMLVGVVEQAWVNRWAPFAEWADETDEAGEASESVHCSQESETM